MRRIRRTTRVGVLLLAGALAAPAAAQDIQYRTVTKVDLGGAMNAMLKLAGASESVETTSIKGGKMRIDDEDRVSTILDLDAGRYIWLDHEQKTYTSVPFEQMGAAIAGMARQATTAAEQAKAEGVTTHREEGEGEVKMDWKFDIDPTGERSNVNGMSAQRVVMTVRTDVEVTPEGEAAEDAGTLILLTDTWNSTDNDAWNAMQEFHQRAAAEVTQAMARDMGGLQSVFLQNPQMGEAVARAAEEANKLEGLPVRTTMILVGVPPGIEFDRELALNPGGAAANKGETAKRAVGGLLRGALGGRRQEEPRDDQPRQGNIMKIVTEVVDVQTTSLPGSLFEIPAGYREVSLGGVSGG